MGLSWTWNLRMTRAIYVWILITSTANHIILLTLSLSMSEFDSPWPHFLFPCSKSQMFSKYMENLKMQLFVPYQFAPGLKMQLFVPYQFAPGLKMQLFVPYQFAPGLSNIFYWMSFRTIWWSGSSSMFREMEWDMNEIAWDLPCSWFPWLAWSHGHPLCLLTDLLFFL